MVTYLRVSALASVLIGVSVPTWQPKATAVVLPDNIINSRVELEFRTNVRLREAKIEVSTAGGVVTLQGVVSNFVDRERAEQLCRQIPGVQSINNKLTTPVSSEGSARLVASIKQRFLEDTLLRGQELTVIAQQGRIVLGGEADGWYPKFHAERIARQAPGVSFVRNDISVQAPSDESLRTVVRDKLERDARFESMLVHVEVEQHFVTLSGYVDSPLQRDLAKWNVESVPGVRGVDNRLVVAYSPEDRLIR
jgi:hyperosmotically inducible protein